MSTQSRWRGVPQHMDLDHGRVAGRDDVRWRGDRMEYLCATSTAGAMAVIAVVGSHRAPRSPAGHMNVWLLGLTDIGPDRQGQSRHLRLADPAPTLQVCFVNTLRPASGGVRGGADGCRVVPRRRGQGRGADRVADGASCFFGWNAELIGIEPRRTWAVGWGAVPKSDCEPGRVAEPEGRPKPLDVGARSLRRTVSQARGGRLGY